MKSEIYQSLLTINQSLETAAEHLEKLKAAEVMLANGADVRKLAIQTLQSEINATVTNAIHTVEMGEASRLEKERIHRQDILKGRMSG